MVVELVEAFVLECFDGESFGDAVDPCDEFICLAVVEEHAACGLAVYSVLSEIVNKV